MERRKITSIFLSCLLATVIFQVSSVQKTYAVNEPVNVWLTKADKSKLLLPQSNVNFSSDSGTNDHTINVNDNVNYQKMDGFGASLTDSSAYLIQNKLSTAARDTLMTNLFDKTNGIGISLLRQTIGSCDYSRNQYSYDEMASGQTDDNLNNFSINHDNEYIVPLLQQALQKNSSIKIMATPWSPPGWMKTSGSMIGGTLNTSAYNAYANYFVKYINAYKELGLPIYAVTVQNEPEYAPPNYPGMVMSASEEANFIKNNLGPTFKDNSIPTKIIAYDHNFNDINYPLSVLGDSGANPYIAGTAWHLYAGGQESMTAVHNAYPTKDNWFTEGSDGSWAGDGSWHDSFKQHMAKAIRVTRNWSKSVLWWNMALDENNGPTVLDKSTCYGVVTVNQLTGAVSYNADYYTLGQFSKFVDSGAYRIESNSFDNDVEDVAFKNPDGSKVIVVNNTNTVDKSVKVKWGSESFTYTIPADSVITFKWSGSQSGSQTIVKPAWYQNFETGSGFTAGTNATVATDSSSANTGGSKSVNLTTSASGDPGSSAQCVNVLPPNENLIDTSPYGYLNFYVKDTQGVNTVKLTFVDKNNAEYSTWTTTRSAKDKWIPINFALCSITGIDKTAIKEIRVGEWNPGVYYFDDFYLSADSTLVIPAFGIDKTTLTTAINDATTLIGSKTVGTEVDNVPQAAKDTYQGAITAATAVSTNTASTQADIDAQVSALATATTNFNSAVIAAPVKWFQNFSAGNGFSSDTQVTTEVATDHANIMDGNSVKMTMSSLAGGYWDNTVAHPADNTKNIKITPMGLATFDATNYSYLIFYVKDMAGSNNNIHIKLKDNLGATWNLGTNDINRATPHFGVQGTWTKIVVTLDKTQALDWSKISEISIQEYWNYSNVYYFDDLYFAQNPINNPPAVNKAALTTAISDATTLIESKTVGTAVGNVPQAATDTFQSAITASTAVIANTAATQAEANAQVAALATATTNFNSAVIIVHESVNPVWYQNFEIGSGFTAGTNATVTTDSSSANRGGLDSVKLTTSASGDPQRSAQCVNVIPQIGTSFDVSSYSYLNFYVKDTQGANTLKLTFVDKDNAEYSMWADQTSSVKDQWTKINCQLSSITGIDKTAIKEIRVGEWNIGVYYFDDFYFSADSTFVIPAFAVDKTELTTATGNAITLIGSKTVGTAVGNVPQAATDTFQSAITASTAVIANTAATQAEANAQIAALATATTNFNSAVIVVNRAALTKAISDATTLIGSKTVGAANGNVPQGAKDDFQSTITAAGIVNENEAATQLAVDAQVTAIATATTNFNNAVIVVNRAALTKVISDATTLIGSKTVGAAVGNVTQIAKDTFQSAITVATAVNTDMKATQADVDAQVSTLATATINFNNALIVAPDKGLQRWVKKIKAQLDNFVKTGIITQNQEDEILKFVNSTKDRDFKKKVKKIKTKLDSLVKAGTITKAQENAIVKFVTHNILEYL